MNKIEAIETLFRMHMGMVQSVCLYAAARLEIADQLESGDKSAAELAEATGVDAAMLYRVMRYLASLGVFEEKPEQRFALTPLSEMMRADVPGSFHPFTIFNTENVFEIAMELVPALQDAAIPFVKKHGKHPFEIMLSDPESAAFLERAWQGVHGPETDAVLDAWDFSDVQKLADIGGGHGDMIVAFLERDTTRSGAIFDIPDVAAQAQTRIDAAGLSQRCEAVGGDFFSEIPVKADTYFLRHILHDWNDEECRTILRNIAAQCEPGARVLIAECVIREPNVPDTGKILDMEMLLYLSGKERTEDEYRALLEETGFDFIGVTPTESMISVVEGRFRGRD
jgi:hypothetical protein